MSLPSTARDSSNTLSLLRSLWLSNLIHDLSSPLFAARGYARLALLDKGSHLTDHQRRYLTAITENLDRIAEATKEFNEFLQEDSLEFEDVSVCDLLDRIFADLDAFACEKKLHYDGLLAERPWVMADREKLDSAVRNFLREAVQFTGDDGTLEISARQESGKILLEFSATRGHAAPGADEPDFSAACKLWRLQGGRVYVNRLSDECFWIGCELPALRASGC